MGLDLKGLNNSSPEKAAIDSWGEIGLKGFLFLVPKARLGLLPFGRLRQIQGKKC